MATIAIIGAGSVGRALGKGFTGHGHTVVHGVRAPGDDRHADLTAVATPSEAAAGADVVIIAVPAGAAGETVASLGLGPGQVVVDATNAVGTPVPGGHQTMGDVVGAALPAGVALVKAFATIGAEHMTDGSVAGDPAFLPVAGDQDGLDVVVPLARELGFDAVALGGRDAFGLVEDHARLWIHLAFRCGWGRGFGFGVLGR